MSDSSNQPTAKEIARQVEELVNKTPTEVIERMMRRLEERRLKSNG